MGITKSLTRLASLAAQRAAAKMEPSTAILPTPHVLSPEDQPGPGPFSGMSDNISSVVTPATPKGGAMTGRFTTTGRGEYEIDILQAPPEELLLTPPGIAIERNKLPADLVIDGHKMTIRKFTDKGFVIFDNGWRDIAVSVALIKAVHRRQPERKTTANNTL